LSSQVGTEANVMTDVYVVFTSLLQFVIILESSSAV